MQTHIPHPDALLALELTGFAARDAENLTGVHRDTWRDWRRRGFIPAGPPPANRRHIGDLTRLFLMRVLANVQGSSPAAAAPLARAFLPCVLARILADPRAVAPDSVEPPEGRVAYVLRMLTLPAPPDGAYGLARAGKLIITDCVETGIARLAGPGFDGALIVADFDRLASAFLHNAAGAEFVRIAAVDLAGIPETQKPTRNIQ